MLKTRPRISVSNFKIILSQSEKKSIIFQIKQVLKSSRWSSGEMGVKFEEAFRGYVGAPYAAAVANGGVGLIAALQALKVPEGSMVICPTLTAPPTPHAILEAGMRVVFVDSSADDLGLDLKEVKKKLDTYRGEIKAVIAVHIGGWVSPRISELNRLCQTYGLVLIEDCAHAHGSFLNGQHAGSTGAIASYSFFMTKSLTSGEGGIVTSRNKNLIDAVKIIRNYGKDRQGRHILKGFNYRISEFNAAVAYWASLNAKRIIARRRWLAAHYDNLLKGRKGISVFNIPECQCGYYKYIIILDKGISRQAFKDMLLKKYGIELAGGIYDVLCHQEPYFKSLSGKVVNLNEKFPGAEDFSRRQVCLPLYLGLKEKQQLYIVQALRSSLKKLS